MVKRSNYGCIHLHIGTGERMRKHYREKEDDGDAPVLSNQKGNTLFDLRWLEYKMEETKQN